MTSSGRRGLLRERTRDQHEAAEAAVEAAGFFGSRAAYGEFVRRNLAFYAAFEALADSAGAAILLPDWAARRKVPALARDCAALGVCPGVSLGAAGGAAACAGRGALGLAVRDGPAGLLGALYVTEGSTLGAAVLARRAGALGLGPASGASFLDGYGAARGARWRAFLERLEGAGIGPGGEERMIAAARATFASYRLALTAKPAPWPAAGP